MRTQRKHCYAKMSEIEAKYFIMSGYNKFTNKTIDAKNKKIVNKSDISGFIKNTGFDKK